MLYGTPRAAYRFPTAVTGLSDVDYAGAQPSIGDSVTRYQGWADDGNPDLFKADRSGPSGAGHDPDIYRGLGGNPDLRF